MTTRGVSRVLVNLVLIGAAVYALIPFLTIIVTSLRPEADLSRGPFTVPSELTIVQNYKRAWVDGRFSLYLKNSLLILVPSVLGNLAVVTFAGYSFAKLKYPGKKLLFAALMLSMMVPFQSVMIPLYLSMARLQLLNKLLGIILLQVGNVGFGVFMMRSFYVSIPNELLEAARLDGCGEVRTLLFVVFPVTFPAWSSLIVFNSFWSWNNLLAPMLFLYRETLFPVPYALYAFQSKFSTDYSLLSAAMLISLLPLVILYLFFQRSFQSGLLGGSIKG
jgi:raffinose/stachyose/melibiose transport system permease protein